MPLQYTYLCYTKCNKNPTPLKTTLKNMVQNECVEIYIFKIYRVKNNNNTQKQLEYYLHNSRKYQHKKIYIYMK